VRYQVDTTGGNSGSPVFNEDTGEAIGIHTHGGCDYSGGYNSGTAVHNSGLANALANPAGICAPIGLTVTNLAGGQTARVTVHGATPGERVFFGFSLTGVGELPVNYLGVIIGLADPVLAGSAIADNSGEAFVEHWINPNQTGRQLWIQAAQKGLTSIVLEEVIQ
jgi:S1-C subfamily serine protease